MQEKTGRFIAVRRRACGMTQRALAEKLGVTDKSISKWERGRCLPDPSLYSALSQALGVTLEDLFAGEMRSQEREIDQIVLSALERSMLRGSDLPADDFHRAMRGFARARLALEPFESKDEAIAYLMKETGISREECAAAYEWIMRCF